MFDHIITWGNKQAAIVKLGICKWGPNLRGSGANLYHYTLPYTTMPDFLALLNIRAFLLPQHSNALTKHQRCRILKAYAPYFTFVLGCWFAWGSIPGLATDITETTKYSSDPFIQGILQYCSFTVVFVFYMHDSNIHRYFPSTTRLCSWFVCSSCDCAPI